MLEIRSIAPVWLDWFCYWQCWGAMDYIYRRHMFNSDVKPSITCIVPYSAYAWFNIIHPWMVALLRVAKNISCKWPMLMKICIKILWLVICLIRINDMYVCKLVPCKLVLYCIRFNTVFTVHGDDARIKVWTTIKDTLCISRDSLYYGSKGCYISILSQKNIFKKTSRYPQ